MAPVTRWGYFMRNQPARAPVNRIRKKALQKSPLLNLTDIIICSPDIMCSPDRLICPPGIMCSPDRDHILCSRDITCSPDRHHMFTWQTYNIYSPDIMCLHTNCFVCMYVCVCTHMCVTVCNVCMCACVCVCVCVCVCACVCVCLCVHVCMHACTRACTFTMVSPDKSLHFRNMYYYYWHKFLKQEWLLAF